MQHDKEAYDRAFSLEVDGLCQNAWYSFNPNDLCDPCRELFLENDTCRCRARAKYVMRSTQLEYRDVRVCGIHRRRLLDGGGWRQVEDQAEIDSAAKVLRAAGYKIVAPKDSEEDK